MLCDAKISFGAIFDSNFDNIKRFYWVIECVYVRARADCVLYLKPFHFNAHCT